MRRHGGIRKPARVATAGAQYPWPPWVPCVALVLAGGAHVWQHGGLTTQPWKAAPVESAEVPVSHEARGHGESCETYIANLWSYANTKALVLAERRAGECACRMLEAINERAGNPTASCNPSTARHAACESGEATRVVERGRSAQLAFDAVVWRDFGRGEPCAREILGRGDAVAKRIIELSLPER